MTTGDNDHNKTILKPIINHELHPKVKIETINQKPGWSFGPGLTKLTELLGKGIKPGEFTILCGSTGSGKTTLIANMVVGLTRMGVKTTMFSVETGPVNFMQQVYSVLMGKDFRDGPSINEEDWQLLELQHANIIQGVDGAGGLIGVVPHESRIPVEVLCDSIRADYKDRETSVFFCDNINFFLEVARFSDQNNEMDKCVHSLIMLCKEIPIHIVMIMHPRKTEDGQVVSEFDIKGSATSVQEASNVLLFNRPKRKDIDEGYIEGGPLNKKEVKKTDRILRLQKSRGINGRNVGEEILFHTDGIVINGKTAQEGLIYAEK